MKKQKYILILLIIIGTLILSGCSNNNNTNKLNLEKECLNNNGKWLKEFNECEGISKEKCESLSGTFNECGSACRNNPKTNFCTMQCIPYCSFK